MKGDQFYPPSITNQKEGDDEPKNHLFLVHFSVLFLAIFE